MTENKIWLELLYLVAGLAIGMALRVNVPKSHPTLVAVPCDCVAI